MQRTLVITGKGKVAINPDTVIIKFPLECRNIDYGKAVSELNNLVNKLKKIVALCGIDETELKTTDFRVDTITKWNKNTEVYDFNGYKAEHDLLIEYPLDNSVTNKLLSSFIKLDLKLDFKISFGVKDKDSCMATLIENAILNAKNKANIIAKSSAISLKEIININYSFVDIFIQSDTTMESTNIVSESNYMFPDINPAEIDLTESITITWRIE